jgi:acyl-CoA thioester hydrolase
MIHTCTIAVRSYELDSYILVNNAVYLNYLDHARMQFLHDIGFRYQEAYDAGFRIVIVNANLEYRKPAFLGDTLTVTTEPIERTKLTGTLRQRITRGSEVIFSGEMRWASCNAEGRPTRLPPDFDLPGLGPQRTL